jgi:hypothetical protein
MNYTRCYLLLVVESHDFSLDLEDKQKQTDQNAVAFSLRHQRSDSAFLEKERTRAFEKCLVL